MSCIREIFHACWCATLAALALAAPHPGFAQTESLETDEFEAEFNFVSPEQREAVSFEIVNGGILFKVNLVGREVWAMLDNSASNSMIDSGFAQSVGLQPGVPAGEIQTLDGPHERRVLPEVNGEIPGQASFRLPLTVIDLSGTSNKQGREVSLIFAKDYFDVLAIYIAPGNMTMQFGPSGSLHPPPDMPYLELENDSPQTDLHQIAVVIAGRPATLVVNLGFGGVIAVNDTAWERLGLNELASFSETVTLGDGSSAPVKATTVEHVTIGPIDAQDIPVITVPHQPGMPPDHPASKWDGALGLGFLSHFNFVIDLGANRIWLSPVASPEGQQQN